MRILFFAEQLSAGGAEYLFLRKARYFKERGHDVHMASAGGALEAQVREGGIPHLRLPSVAQWKPDVPYDEALADARRFERYVRHHRIEVVDALPIKPFLMAHHVAGAAGIPVFLECLSPTHFLPIRHAALARAAAASGLLVAMDAGDAAGSCPRLGVDLKDVRIIPNPVDLRRFRPGPSSRLRSELGAPEGDFIVLSASRLDPDKAGYVRILLDDFAEMAAHDAGIWLAIAGDGTERAALEAHAFNRGIPRVRFLGMRANLEDLYPGADAFVGMGTTVIEAAACGTAVVVANALTLRQGAVTRGEVATCYFGHLGASTVGYRVPPSEPGTFRSYLERLRSDPALREQVAREARAMAVSTFGMERVLEQWEAAYRDAVAAARSGHFARSADSNRPAGPFPPASPVPAAEVPVMGSAEGPAIVADEPPATIPGETPATGPAKRPVTGVGMLRVLFCTRPDAFSNPGGDTIQLLCTRRELTRLGLQVDVSLSAAPDARGYDLVHLFNLQTAGLARSQMDAIVRAGVPVVVSPIFWDHTELERVTPRLRGAFAAPIEASVPGRERMLEALERELRRLVPGPAMGSGTRPGDGPAMGVVPWPGGDPRLGGEVGPGDEEDSAGQVDGRLLAQRRMQRQVASMADLLLPNSEAEAAVLGRVLGNAIAPCLVVPNGIDAARLVGATPDAFVARYGRRDFVLSAARWDDRKNLLMLCEAVRTAGLPLVLAGPRPNAEYERLVRQVMPPDTLVLDTLGQDELASAYAAARVHALPSWFETPGLSSLEAAAAGCAIVVGDRAAEREYFGDLAYYCDPASVASIREALTRAWQEYEGGRSRREALRSLILDRYTWPRAAARTIEAYSEVLGRQLAEFAVSYPEGSSDRRNPRVAPGPRDAATSPGEGDREQIGPGRASLHIAVGAEVPARGDGKGDRPVDRGAGSRNQSIEIIRAPDGLDFGPAVAGACSNSTADILVLIGSGVQVPDEVVGLLANGLAADPGIGAVGPISDGGAPLQHVSLYLPPEAITGRTDAEILQALARTARGPIRVELLGRFCLAIRREALVAAGGWDQKLAPVHAELDLAWRLRHAGFRLALVPDAFVRAGSPPPRPPAAELQASADRLAAKLERAFGRGRVPRPEALWGIRSFHPSIDLWGPRPTLFRLSLAGDAAPYRRRVEDAFAAAFGPEDPVTLELADPGSRDSQPAPASQLTSPACQAAEAIAGSGSEPAVQVVPLEPGARVPACDPARVTPDLLRQLAGYRPRPLQRGHTTIILLAVDRRDYMRLCLDTLFGCTHEPFELVVVDGGVGEATRQVIAGVAAARPECLWLRTEAPASAAHLLDLGLAAANGEFVALLKGDTVVAEGWLTYLIGHLLANPAAGLVGPRSNGGPGSQPLAEIPYDAIPEMADFARAMARGNAGLVRPTSLIGTFAAVLRRDLVEDVGAFDPAYPTGTFEAPDYCLRVALAGRAILLAEDVFVHHFGTQPPSPQVPDSPVKRGLDLFEERWGPLPQAPGRDGQDPLAALRAIWDSRQDRPGALALPRRRGLPLVVEPARIEGAKEFNFLLVPDWESEPPGWENTIRQYAETFDGDSPVTLLVPPAPASILQRISSILEEAHADGNTPDVLILDDIRNLSGIVAASQAVMRSAGTLGDRVARIAEILGIPVCETTRIPLPGTRTTP